MDAQRHADVKDTDIRVTRRVLKLSLPRLLSLLQNLYHATSLRAVWEVVLVGGGCTQTSALPTAGRVGDIGDVCESIFVIAQSLLASYK